MSVYTEIGTTPAQPVTTPDTADEIEIPSSRDIRDWARAQGIQVGRRGPLNPSVIVRYMQSRNA